MLVQIVHLAHVQSLLHCKWRKSTEGVSNKTKINSEISVVLFSVLN